MTNDERDLRFAAQSLYQNANNMYRPNQLPHHGSIEFSRSSQAPSVNVYSEEFLVGYTHNGQMSVIRRFFCLFVTFDLIFISLLWLICILITGDDIYVALKTQIIQYNVHKSIFDVVMSALCRFTVLILFYGLLSINHWFIIAFSTTGSCLFLIYKVFVFNWIDTPQPVFEVLLILVSFVLAWGETWYLDFRVIPQESHARNYLRSLAPYFTVDDRTPLMAPFLTSTIAAGAGPPPESIYNFYSPYESIHNSDNDDDDQNEEYRDMGKECVRRAIQLLENSEWKIEKTTSMGDTIKSTNQKELGKVWRLTGKISFPAKLLLEHLFDKIEDISKWNPTILESKILRKIDSHTDITYQATAGGAGGMVKSRDFINLRCWYLCRNGEIILSTPPPSSLSSSLPIPSPSSSSSSNGAKSSTAVPINKKSPTSSSKNDDIVKSSSIKSTKLMHKSFSDYEITHGVGGSNSNRNNKNDLLTTATLSKSLGAKGFFHDDIQSGDDETFTDAEDDNNLTNVIVIPTDTADDMKSINNVELVETTTTETLLRKKFTSENLYVSAAISIPYEDAPKSSKYVRGENLLSSWAFREIDGKPDSCIFEWLLCIDLKGYFPRYVLDAAYTTLMQDYMVYLRKYCLDNQQTNTNIHPSSKTKSDGSFIR